VNRFKLAGLTLVASGALLASSPAAIHAAGGKASGTGGARAGLATVRGTVASFTATSVTVAPKSGADVVVDFTATTKFRVNGAPSTSAPTFTAGEPVGAAGTKNADGSITAKLVVAGTNPNKANRVRVAGTVSASASGSLTITPKTGSAVTVTLDAKTRYIVNGVASSTAPTFTNGEKVLVGAIKNSDGSLTARVVATGVRNPNAVRLIGTISAVGSSSLTLTGKNGQSATVALTSSTKYRVNGQVSSTAPTFTVGEKAVVAATKNSDGSLTARGVAVNPAKQAAKAAAKTAKQAAKAAARAAKKAAKSGK